MFAHSMRRALTRNSPTPLNNLFSLRMLQAASQARNFSVAAKRFPDEPAAPVLKTEFPGPLSKASIAEYGDVSCNKQQQFPIDLEASYGNYIADIDGNKFLDVFTSIACIGMGYNHPVLLETARSDLMKAVVVNRTGM